MKLLYPILIRFYGMLIYGFSFFNDKASEWILGRRRWREKVKSIPKGSIWIHCASLGEFDQAAPIIRLLKEHDSTIRITVSFFSPSGMKHFHKRELPVDNAVYLPLDTFKNAFDFVDLLMPCMAIFVKYEFWPNHLRVISKMQIPIISLSSIFRPNQLYFKWYGKFFFEQIKKIDYFFVQDSVSERFLKGFHGVLKTGDTRFDTVIQNAEKSTPNSDSILSNFTKNSFVLILGSSWREEEKILIQCIKKEIEIKVIIAPHDVREFNIERIQTQLPCPAQRYTTYRTDSKETNVLILDTIGNLSSAYAYADLAFVGGGFSGKLHNILEPAAHGLPVMFGPRFSKFPEATLFLEKKIAHVVRNSNDLEMILIGLSKENEGVKNRIKDTIQKQSGASEKVMEKLKELKLI